jgi:hypothetical protein
MPVNVTAWAHARRMILQDILTNSTESESQVDGDAEGPMSALLPKMLQAGQQEIVCLSLLDDACQQATLPASCQKRERPPWLKMGTQGWFPALYEKQNPSRCTPPAGPCMVASQAPHPATRLTSLLERDVATVIVQLGAITT